MVKQRTAMTERVSIVKQENVMDEECYFYHRVVLMFQTDTYVNPGHLTARRLKQVLSSTFCYTLLCA